MKMTYEELYSIIADMPYFNPILEKRNTVHGIRNVLSIQEEHGDFKTTILDERFTNVDTKNTMLFIIKEQLEDDILVLKEIIDFINEL